MGERICKRQAAFAGTKANSQNFAARSERDHCRIDANMRTSGGPLDESKIIGRMSEDGCLFTPSENLFRNAVIAG